MNASANLNDIPAVPAPDPDPDESLDPAEAAGILRATQQRARSRLGQQSPWLSVLGAGLILGIYGSIWLSVRGQHPYTGPSLAVIGVVYLSIVVFGAVGSRFLYQARVGISGRSRREETIRGIVIAVAIAGIYTFMAALKHDGFSAGVVYGVVDAAGPWLVGGAAFAGWAAAKEDWWKLGVGIGLVVVGAGAAFAGPENVWGILAVVGAAGCIGHAVWQAIWVRRA